MFKIGIPFTANFIVARLLTAPRSEILHRVKKGRQKPLLHSGLDVRCSWQWVRMIAYFWVRMGGDRARVWGSSAVVERVSLTQPQTFPHSPSDCICRACTLYLTKLQAISKILFGLEQGVSFLFPTEKLKYYKSNMICPEYLQSSAVCSRIQQGMLAGRPVRLQLPGPLWFQVPAAEVK